MTALPKSAALFLAVALLPAAGGAALRFTNTPVRAVVTVADRESAVTLAGRTDVDLFYSPPNVPAGVYASIPLATLQQIQLDYKLDQAALDKAVMARRWREAAGLTLRALEPVLPYVDLPGNEAAEILALANGYLLKEAAVARQGGPEAAKSAPSLLAMVVRLSDRLQGAIWFYGAEAARLHAVQALASLGQLEAAGKRMEDAAIPEPGDGDFGLYWMTKALLAEAAGKYREAIDAAARSLAFDNKNPDTFGPALMLYARACEQAQDWYRARDVYLEVSRLFRGADHGDLASQRLGFIMKEGLTAEKEAANVAKLFFGSEEDMDALAQSWLDELAKQSNAQPSGGVQQEEKKP